MWNGSFQGEEVEQKISQILSHGTTRSTVFRRTKCGMEQLVPFRPVPSHVPNGTPVLELQGVLKINKSLKKEVDELQRVRVGLLEKNEQMKGENDGLKFRDLLYFSGRLACFCFLRLPLVKLLEKLVPRLGQPGEKRPMMLLLRASRLLKVW
ncbi:hypothetical protein ACFXTI_027881 [Malus domestica]|uniref:Uncharacterized protein n=1 Tax=Malus domestica TaxID=3750 RepID=A0A498KMR6_MALDO|nr:hypothetical protein DVH24_025739 [Malus domestica]